MKRNVIAYILIGLGTVPFLAALILGLPMFRVSYLTYGEFLILWSYLFWPTYILGILLIAAGLLLRFWNIKAKHSDIKEKLSCSTEK
jgi:hypothetical protein